LKARQAVTVEQFCRYPHLIVSPTEGRFVGPTDRALAEIGSKRHVMLSTPGFLILPEILQTDAFIPVVPHPLLPARATLLPTFAPPVKVPGFSVVLLWHRRLQEDPAHRWLRDLLASTAQGVRKTSPTASVKRLHRRR